MRALILDTNDSVDPSNAGDSQFILQHLEDLNVQDVDLSLSSVLFMNTIYPFNSRNNTLIFQEDGVNTDLTATIPAGNYTVTNLLTELKTQLDSAGSNTYTVTYSDTTLKITIATDGTSVKLTEDSTCLKELGFPITGTSFGDPLTSSYPIELDGSNYLKIIANFGSNISSSNERVLDIVPLTSSVGSLHFYEKQNLEWHRVDIQSLSNLRLQLRDDKGNLFILPQNGNVIYRFLIKY